LTHVQSVLAEMQAGSVLHLSACLSLDTAHSNPGQATAAAAAAAAANAAATAAEAAVVAAAAAQHAANAATNASARTAAVAANQGHHGQTHARRRAVRPDDSWRTAPQKRRSKSPGYQKTSGGRSRRLTSKQRQQWTAKGCHPEGGGHSAKSKDGQPRKAPPRHYWSAERAAAVHQQTSKWKVVEHPSSAQSSQSKLVHQSSQTALDAAEATATTNSADDETKPVPCSNRAAEPQRFSLTTRDSDDDEADFFPKDAIDSKESDGSEVADILVPQEASQDGCLLPQEASQDGAPDSLGHDSGCDAQERGPNGSRETTSVEEPRIELHAEVVRQTESSHDDPQEKLQTEAKRELHESKGVDPPLASGGAGENR